MHKYYPNIIMKDNFHSHVKSGFVTVTPGDSKRNCSIKNKNMSTQMYVTATDDNSYCIVDNGKSSYSRMVINFTINDDGTITIDNAEYKRRHLNSSKNLKQFENIVSYCAYGIMSDKIVEY